MADRNIVRIKCEFCNTDLGIPVEDITEEGKWVPCPRCQKNLFIQKSQFEKFFEYSMHCPKCGELQKPSEECISCSVIIKKYLKLKELDSAWDVLSKRFAPKVPSSQDLVIKCPNCGFSKNLSKDKCPSYITRIGCPSCNQSFDIVNWVNIDDESPKW